MSINLCEAQEASVYMTFKSQGSELPLVENVIIIIQESALSDRISITPFSSRALFLLTLYASKFFLADHHQCPTHFSVYFVSL